MALESIAREGKEFESVGIVTHAAKRANEPGAAATAVLNGYSVAQLTELLGCISASADTLVNLTEYVAQSGDPESQYQMLGIQAIAQKIGALADAALAPDDRAQSSGALAWFGFAGVPRE